MKKVLAVLEYLLEVGHDACDNCSAPWNCTGWSCPVFRFTRHCANARNDAKKISMGSKTTKIGTN